jgi:hypothetical protein
MIKTNERTPLRGALASGMILALTLTLVCAGCDDSPAAPGADLGLDSSPDLSSDLSIDGQVEDTGADLPQSDLAVDAVVTDVLPTDQQLGDLVPGNFYSSVIHGLCPPKAIAQGSAYKLKVRYQTMCLGAAPSTLCVVKVKSGKVIELGLYLQQHLVGCDATDIGVFDATCDLPSLPAGSYTLTDKKCPSGSQKLDVVGAAVGQPTCVDTGC